MKEVLSKMMEPFDRHIPYNITIRKHAFLRTLIVEAAWVAIRQVNLRQTENVIFPIILLPKM